MKTGLQKAMEQIGEDAVRKSIPQGYGIGRCSIHGAYLIAPTVEPLCPVCPSVPAPNGLSATNIEHYIDMEPVKGTNPQQQINPYGV